MLSIFIILLCCFVAIPQWLMILGIITASLRLLSGIVEIVWKAAKTRPF
jgi:hypothetical protein